MCTWPVFYIWYGLIFSPWLWTFIGVTCSYSSLVLVCSCVVIRCTRHGWRKQLHTLTLTLTLIVGPRDCSLAINSTQVFVLELSLIWTVNFFSNSRQTASASDVHSSQKLAPLNKWVFLTGCRVCEWGKMSEARFIFSGRHMGVVTTVLNLITSDRTGQLATLSWFYFVHGVLWQKRFTSACVCSTWCHRKGWPKF